MIDHTTITDQNHRLPFVGKAGGAAVTLEFSPRHRLQTVQCVGVSWIGANRPAVRTDFVLIGVDGVILWLSEHVHIF